MGLTITLEDFQGNILKQIPVEISPNLFEELPADEFKLLKYIDPYDDTIFNGLMCRDLLIDLTNLNCGTIKDAQINEIIELVSNCINEPHTYVKFLGD